MTRAPQPHRSLAANLFMLAGVILIVAGALTAFASPPADDAAPPNYGESAPPLLPTVTALPAEGQIAPAPQELPDTEAQSSATASPTTQLPSPPQGPIVPAPTATPNPADRVPRRIVIPAIKLDAPIETVGWHVINGVSTWDVPDHLAAGWLKTSAVLGQPGNTVLDGHHNIAGQVFRHLVDLKLGDEIEVFADGEVFTYKITTRQILKERDQPLAVRLKNAQWIQPTIDERLTLVTCWPYTTNTHRLIIVAEPWTPTPARGLIQ
jgi:LPXTG-site transpeptidase (sortase) family protein